MFSLKWRLMHQVTVELLYWQTFFDPLWDAFFEGSQRTSTHQEDNKSPLSARDEAVTLKCSMSPKGARTFQLQDFKCTVIHQFGDDPTWLEEVSTPNWDFTLTTSNGQSDSIWKQEQCQQTAKGKQTTFPKFCNWSHPNDCCQNEKQRSSYWVKAND